MVVGLIAVGCWIVIDTHREKRLDEQAELAATKVTEGLTREFKIDDAMEQVRAVLSSSHWQTLQRGEGELFVVAQEGAGVWYCSHVFHGAMLRSAGGRLTSIRKELFYQDCL